MNKAEGAFKTFNILDTSHIKPSPSLYASLAGPSVGLDYEEKLGPLGKIIIRLTSTWWKPTWMQLYLYYYCYYFNAKMTQLLFSFAEGFTWTGRFFHHAWRNQL